jgi:hypothetical protein
MNQLLMWTTVNQLRTNGNNSPHKIGDPKVIKWKTPFSLHCCVLFTKPYYNSGVGGIVVQMRYYENVVNKSLHS